MKIDAEFHESAQAMTRRNGRHVVDAVIGVDPANTFHRSQIFESDPDVTGGGFGRG
jgi:hypothetical protein